MKVLLTLLFLFSLFVAPVSAHVDPNDPNATHHAGDAEISIEENVVQENPLPHLNQITLYILVALGGIAAGSLATFLLLTVTLHPKQG